MLFFIAFVWLFCFDRFGVCVCMLVCPSNLGLHSSLKIMVARKHTHTHLHLHRHTRLHLHTQTHTHTHIHTHTHKYIHTYMMMTTMMMTTMKMTRVIMTPQHYGHHSSGCQQSSSLRREPLPYCFQSWDNCPATVLFLGTGLIEAGISKAVSRRLSCAKVLRCLAS